MFDVEVVPGTRENKSKPGVKCAVSQWHWETGQFSRSCTRTFGGRAEKHFITEYDIRAQLCGMLHRLLHGTPWKDMPLAWGPTDPMRSRRLTWWRKGARPEVMESFGTDSRGAEAYRRPMLPQLTVTGRLRSGLLVEVRTEAPGMP